MVENRSSAPPAAASATTRAAVASATHASAPAKEPESLHERAVTPPASSAVSAATSITPVMGKAAVSSAPAGSAARTSTAVEAPLLPPHSIPTTKVTVHTIPTTTQ